MTEVTIGAPKPPSRRRSLLLTRVTPGIALLVLASIAVLRIWVVEMAIVEGNSMKDTLQTGDRVLISKLLQVTRFDIIVLRDPETSGTDIKRVVGVPGDVISMVPYVGDTGGGRTAVYGSQLYINSIPYKEPYATSIIPKTMSPGRMKPDSYWVLGDNRDDSIDSRKYGQLKGKSIRGVAIAVVYPPSRIRLLDRDPKAVPDMDAIKRAQ
jgi:signal peptidase I